MRLGGLLGCIEFWQTDCTIQTIMSSRETAKYHQRHRILVHSLSFARINYFIFMSRDLRNVSERTCWVSTTAKNVLFSVTQLMSLTLTQLSAKSNSSVMKHTSFIEREKDGEWNCFIKLSLLLSFTILVHSMQPSFLSRHCKPLCGRSREWRIAVVSANGYQELSSKDPCRSLPTFHNTFDVCTLFIGLLTSLNTRKTQQV